MRSTSPIEISIFTQAERLAHESGSYNGLFYDNAGIAHESSGFFSLTMTSPGAFSAVLNEGYLTQRVRPYAIPYRALTPRRGDCENLIVPVCVSATHVAYSSLRMEPNYAVFGHAAGVAAALAVRADRAVQDLDVTALRERLRAQGAALDVNRAAVRPS